MRSCQGKSLPNSAPSRLTIPECAQALKLDKRLVIAMCGSHARVCCTRLWGTSEQVQAKPEVHAGSDQASDG